MPTPAWLERKKYPPRAVILWNSRLARNRNATAKKSSAADAIQLATFIMRLVILRNVAWGSTSTCAEVPAD